MSESKFTGADAHIYVDMSFHEKNGITLVDLLRQHTILPSKKEHFPKMTIFFGPGRSCSTAWALLASSNPYCIGAAYQPIKSLARHGPKYGDIHVPTLNGGLSYAVAPGQPFWFMTKETAGPFHPWENLQPGISAIDPFYIWTELGYPPDKITGVALIRDPREVFISNFKFEGGIDAQVLVSNYQGVLELYEYYKHVFQIIPFVYDLCGDYSTETVVVATMNKIGVPYNGLSFDQASIDQKLQLLEASQPDEYKDIVAPTLAKGEFGYPKKRGGIPDSKRDQIEPYLGLIEKECNPIFEYFMNEEKEKLQL